MTIICTARHDAKIFTWCLEDKTATAFASDLGRVKLFAQIYDDACDEGFTLLGRQGNATFYVEHTEYDREGDLRFWRLAPVAETLRAMPILKGYKVTVFNT